MTKRLYFTCPIKAAYMAKYFEVKLNIRIFAKSEISNYNIDTEIMLRDQDPAPFYVAKQSEHIFEPQEGDLDADGFSFTKGTAVENHMTGKIDYYTDACWLLKIEEFTRSKEKSKTIFRDNKQFFEPEVENENN